MKGKVVMNQNHWKDDNDTNQNDCNEYTSSQTVTSSEPKTKKKANRIAMIVTVTLLCAAFCFGAGALGAMMMDMIYDGDNTSWHNPSNEDHVTFDPPHDDVGAMISDDEDDVQRRPLPEIEKSNGVNTLTYAGSAGDAAYRTLAEAYATVADTVVEISTETVVNGGWLGNYVSSGAGSGVIVSSDGYIVTNHHVIDGADAITVRLKDGAEYQAKIIGKDSATDIAVIRIEGNGEFPAARLGCSADLIVGEPVFAIGNPLGSLGGTLTDGIISATARQMIIDGQKMTLLQTNTAVNPGNSGGGLFNMAGQLIGVVNAKCSEDDVEGLGFAIPIDTAYEVICELIEYGYVRGVVDSGLTVYDVSNTLTAWKNFGSTRLGAYIVESRYSDELQFGDYLLNINGTPVASGADVETVLSDCAVGDTVTVEVIRMQKKNQDGKTVLVETTVSVSLVLKEYVPTDVDVRFDTN